MRIQKIHALLLAVQAIWLLGAQDSTLWAQTWEPGVPMLSLRTSPGVTVGSDGLIYAIGGTADMYGSQYATNTAERFNEVTGTWEWIESMQQKRLSPGAITDSVGRIWVVGGNPPGPEYHDTVEVYDPMSGSWSTHPARLNTARSGHGIAITKDDVIYVFGGLFSPPEVYLSSVEKFDPSTGTWEFVASMNEARGQPGYAMDEQGRIYAIGGGRSGIGVLKTVERYDPLEDEWEYVADLPEIRGSMATFVCCGEIWAVGGGKNVPYYTDTSYIYSPETNTWREGPHMYEAIGHARGVVGSSGTAYVIGGEGPDIWAHNRVAILEGCEPPLLVETPNGGESWIAGTKQAIQWETHDPCITDVKIEYSTNNATDWNNVTVANTGSYEWTVPQVTSSKCLVRISDANDADVYDISDNVFVIYVCQLSSVGQDADLDNNCRVDFVDFSIWAQQWLNNGNPFDPEFTEAPEGMVLIPGGTFEMGDSFSEGSDRERPVHTVTVDSFYMGKYEITNAQYCEYLNSVSSQGLITVTSDVVYQADSGTSYPYCSAHNSSSYSQIDYNDVTETFSVRSKSGRSMVNDPMVMVSWYGAAAYCNWRSQEEGYEICYDTSDPNWPCDFNKYGYRLATEAEWEYAARGGLTSKRFPWGDDIYHTQANYYSSTSYLYDKGPTKGYHPLWDDGIQPYTSPVGFFDGTMKYKTDYQWSTADTSYQTTSGANNYGLCDMASNVWEWCNDWFDYHYYDYSPMNNPTGPTTGTRRTSRGGPWYYVAPGCRVAWRDVWLPEYLSYAIGIRVVLSLHQ